MQVQVAAKKTVVTERALFARLDRQMRREYGVRLRKCPYNSKWFGTVGRYYSTEGNYIRNTGINLEAWGREDGVLKEWEVVKEED